ncbi:MAG: alpha/beta hydrolase [Gammaproteobacteria bacterium]|uniref:alpha/beta fold hydrolase n=1 Tax=Pseudomaricurvus alcaniphilus TaxID=1166482 RepID=UPI001408C45C|nr:alpha/beta hydrolase [Pseudomaricurvus alcaniphilus]MBR9909747.1 alpha/beta hydrolase [Gammaproteobacteria bacterium]NHN38466.1 alpha/beta hydrolase [Pseudomaricurvus alcaniphilus]
MFKFKGAENNILTADIVGHSSCQPVLLLHGGGQTRHAWRDSASMLADDGYFAISADLRGHGDSDWVASGQYSIATSAADIACIVSHLDRPAILVGASYGGLSAMYLAGLHPELVRALVLVDVVPKINTEGAAGIQAFMRSAPDGFGNLEEAADAIAAYIPHRERPKNLDGLQKNLRLRDNGRYYWHWDPAFLQMKRPDDMFEQLVERAKKIEAPTLLVRGSKSDVVDDEGVEHFRELMPHAQYVQVEGAGHMVAGDENNAFHDAVINFLQQL